ncbi:MAG: NADH-quinone oxidoreductase subunit J [Actinomycetia bacterium]|nr:NADH-quinone oxidoreductase subunit J [Actinomycetes bacterium]
MTLEVIAFTLAGLLAAGGAVAVLFVREAMRLMIGLGSFLLGVAGLFLYFGLPFLATAQVFVYVGGVLVLMVFAVMVVHRQADDRPVMEVRHDVGAAAVALAVTVTIVACLRSVVGDALPTPGVYSGVLADELLGPKLLVFEMAGALLLTGLVAVLTIREGEDR